MTRPRPPAVPSTYLSSSSTQEQPLRKEQPLGSEEYLSALGRLSDSKEYLSRMGHCQEYVREQPSGREQNQLHNSTQEKTYFATQEQIQFSTQEQIHLSTQEQTVSFVSRPSPLLLLPDKVLYTTQIYIPHHHKQR